jgi:hypothetical protein
MDPLMVLGWAFLFFLVALTIHDSIQTDTHPEDDDEP